MFDFSYTIPILRPIISNEEYYGNLLSKDILIIDKPNIWLVTKYKIRYSSFIFANQNIRFDNHFLLYTITRQKILFSLASLLEFQQKMKMLALRYLKGYTMVCFSLFSIYLSISLPACLFISLSICLKWIICPYLTCVVKIKIAL